MDIKTIEWIEKDDPSEETLRLTRWKEITKPGDYSFTQGQWKKYNPSRALRAETNRSRVVAEKKQIAMETHGEQHQRNRRRAREKKRIP